MRIKLRLVYALAALLLPFHANSFCGIFVADADSKLFNESSQVILVRDGNSSIVVMSNDYKGEVDEFAMVVPVPVVLQEGDIQIADATLFNKFDKYSAPRMTMYYDKNPCPYPKKYRRFRAKGGGVRAKFGGGAPSMADRGERSYGVTIEAQYAVGEYDILILSAKESDGLKRWLTDNKYKLPEKAEEVLDPYIKGGMKFFVAKVNLDRQGQAGNATLNPLSIRYEHDKFMLPIRLGMANSTGTQDLIVYALTTKGRIECTNYRTVKMPSNRNVPTFVQQDFGPFYKDVFDKQYEQQLKKAVFLEYAWDISQRTQMKCDPCNGQPPVLADLQKLGVPWAADAEAKTYFTRLHVRYDRANFPQDLQFQVTPNTTNYQVRYYMKRPASYIDCAEAQTYIKELIQRRTHELEEMEILSGRPAQEHYASYVQPYKDKLKQNGGEDGKVIFDFDTGYLGEDPENNRATLASGSPSVLLQLMGYGAVLLLVISLYRRFAKG